jgi:ABC-type transporter Mla subunit MlaD
MKQFEQLNQQLVRQNAELVDIVAAQTKEISALSKMLKPTTTSNDDFQHALKNALKELVSKLVIYYT